jgi:hypothetical protein
VTVDQEASGVVIRVQGSGVTPGNIDPARVILAELGCQ